MVPARVMPLDMIESSSASECMHMLEDYGIDRAKAKGVPIMLERSYGS